MLFWKRFISKNTNFCHIDPLIKSSQNGPITLMKPSNFDFDMLWINLKKFAKPHRMWQNQITQKIHIFAEIVLEWPHYPQKPIKFRFWHGLTSSQKFVSVPPKIWKVHCEKTNFFKKTKNHLEAIPQGTTETNLVLMEVI